MYQCVIADQYNFNSLPHTEVDVFIAFFPPYGFLFQLTTSHRGRLQVLLFYIFQRYFNSLPHTEVDWICARIPCCGFLFQLTTSHRGRPPSIVADCTADDFNSLPHTEVDSILLSGRQRQVHFNSLPHTEVDDIQGTTNEQEKIFQLTTSHRGRRR